MEYHLLFKKGKGTLVGYVDLVSNSSF